MLLTVGLLLAPAASATTGSIVKVPFAFEAYGKVLPAGEYRILPLNYAGNYRLVGPDGRTVLFMPGAITSNWKPGQPNAEFLSKDGKYVLTAVSLQDANGRVAKIKVSDNLQ
jgi:hypothetical protein